MNIFSKMDNLVSLTENEKILVSYIKENPEAFVKMTSAEISEASFISNATIYRLCKKMDLAGLSELKILVSASVGDYLKERKTLDFNYPIHPNETQYQITRTMQELYETPGIEPPKSLQQHRKFRIENSNAIFREKHAD